MYGRAASPGLDGDAVPAEAQAVLAAALDAGPTPAQADAEARRAAFDEVVRTTDPQWRDLNKQVEEHAKKGAAAGDASEGDGVQRGRASNPVPHPGRRLPGADALPGKRGDPNQKDGVAAAGFLASADAEAGPGNERWRVSADRLAARSHRRRSLANWMTDVDAGAWPAAGAGDRQLPDYGSTISAEGIVGTPSDFGNQGEKPTHPELLDWLAKELIDSGWEI